LYLHTYLCTLEHELNNKIVYIFIHFISSHKNIEIFSHWSQILTTKMSC